ncbi:MAG: hypothetical protein AAFQ87_10335 [Bacteroidota bacterium]
MNFLSHYYLDRDVDNPYFTVGVSTPDLVSIFNRRVRLKANNMPDIKSGEVSPEQVAFYNGILQHFEADRIFHTSDFFKEETELISRRLTTIFGAERISRGFFVAHVFLEILLDKILIEHDRSLADTYYRHLNEVGVARSAELTQWAVQQQIPRYLGFFERFVDRQYLYHYADWQEVIIVLRRILMRVSIHRFEYLHSPRFLQFAQEYQQELTGRVFGVMDTFQDELRRK